MTTKPPVFVAIAGAKASVGASVFSVNFAISLARDANARVCLLDFDTDSAGDISLLLAAENAPTISELAEKVGKVDIKTFYSSIAKTKSGMNLIPLTRTQTDLKTLSVAQIDKVFKQLSAIYNYIIIDTGANFNSFTLKPFEYASLVVYLTTQDLMTVNQGASRMRGFSAMQLPSEMIWLIVNKFDARSIITKQIIGQKLKKEPLMVLPDEVALVTQSVNGAQPFVLSQPGHALTKAYDSLARYLIKTESTGKLRRAEGAGSIGAEILGTLNPLLSGGSGGTAQGTSVSADVFSMKRGENADVYREIKIRVHKRLVELVEMNNMNDAEGKRDPKKVQELENKTREIINGLLDKESSLIKGIEDRRKLAKEIFDEALGLGCLEELLADPDVSEIMVNHKDQIYAEKGGKLKLTNLRFTTSKHLMGVIERIVNPIGRRIDEKSPMVDARLRDGSRVNAIIPPLALKGAMLTIRKFSKDRLTYKDLVRFGAMTEEIADFLRACVEARLNIIVSGGTGSGKTTLLNVIGSFIPADERIITVEDSAELNLPQEHVGTLETRPPNIQGEGEIAIRDLVKNTLRMRPDRIIIGECRGAEALDMLQAMNTGHDGSLTTIHSNTPRDSIARLETLVMFAGFDLPAAAIKSQIASAVHMIVQLNRFSDGSRKITHITEVTGMEGNTVVLQDIFLYKQKGLNAKGKVMGDYVSTGLIPKFVQTLKEKGVRLPKGLFTPKA
jgi:septum site-determining protein MinD